MRRVRHLPTLGKAADRRLLRLSLLVRDIHPAMTAEEARSLAFVTIEAANLWAAFSRTLYLSAATGAVDGGGQKVSTTVPISSVPNALTIAVHYFKPRLQAKSGPWSSRDEPDWQSPNVLLKALQLVGASNAEQVSAALSVPNDATRHLPTVRNFFAHRGETAAAKVRPLARQYSLGTGLRPEELCSSRGPRRPQSILSDWISELRVLIDLATS
jgi:hypothetical protein